MSARRAAAAPDLAETASRLRLSATRLARQLRQQSPAGVTPSQLSALASIDSNGPLTLGALADHEAVAPPSITRMVGRLEEEGLVARVVDPADRRSQVVSVTPEGVALLREIRSRRDAWLADRLRALPKEQLVALTAALDALDTLAARPAPPPVDAS